MTSSGIFPTDDWTVAEGETDAGPVFLRYRSGEPIAAEKAKFTHLIMITWAYEPRDESGLPTSETLEAMDVFEERVLDASDRDGWWGSGVAVVTHGGTREWRFYAPDVNTFLSEFNATLEGLGPFPLSLEAFEDPEWQAFEEIKPGT